MTLNSTTDHYSIAFIGAGRLAQSLAVALERCGQPVAMVASRRPESAQCLARALSRCRAVPVAEAAQADLVLITVTDDAIPLVANALQWRQGQCVVHCSGATEVSALDAAARAGAMTGGFHPLQNFSDPMRAVDMLAGSVVAIEGPSPLEAELRAIAKLLKMHPLTLQPGARALYHGSACYLMGSLLALLGDAVDMWGRFDIDEAQASRALLAVARGTIEAASSRGVAEALVGPFSRGDAGVVWRHRQAFEALGDRYGLMYRDLGRRQLTLACRSGRLNEDQLQRLEGALS